MSQDSDGENFIIYEICLKGGLPEYRSDWFEGMTLTLNENGDSLLTGPVADQAALHGLLAKVRDLGLVLIFVKIVEPC